MSFWNKNKLPAEYKDMTEDQIAAALEAGKTASSEAIQMKTNAETAEAARKKAADEAADLRRQLDARPPAEQQRREETNQTTNTPVGDADWLVNGNDAFQRSVAPIAAVALHGAIMSARMQADSFIRQQGPVNARLWNKYVGEVEKIVNSLAPDQRILPQTWINNFTFVKGMHLDEVVKEGQAAGDAFFSETATSTGRGLPEDSHQKDDTLTDQEKKIAKQFGRSEEQYLASKKKMQFGPAIA